MEVNRIVAVDVRTAKKRCTVMADIAEVLLMSTNDGQMREARYNVNAVGCPFKDRPPPRLLLQTDSLDTGTLAADARCMPS